MATSDVNHLVSGTPEAIVALMIVFIVCRIALSKLACSIFVSLLSETRKIYNDLDAVEMNKL